jgi:hypothetical protein
MLQVIDPVSVQNPEEILNLVITIVIYALGFIGSAYTLLQVLSRQFPGLRKILKLPEEFGVDTKPLPVQISAGTMGLVKAFIKVFRPELVEQAVETAKNFIGNHKIDDDRVLKFVLETNPELLEFTLQFDSYVTNGLENGKFIITMKGED